MSLIGQEYSNSILVGSLIFYNFAAERYGAGLFCTSNSRCR